MKKLTKMILLIGFLMLLSIGWVLAQTAIAPEDLVKWQESKTPFLLIDVRNRQHFDLKHIVNAINIPSFAIHQKGFPRSAKIILCDGGIGSLQARQSAERLAAAGYTSIFVLEGGVARWEASGLPVVVPRGLITTRLVESITVSELSQAMRDDFAMTVIDLRRSDLFHLGTIPGARNIPPENLPGVASGWGKDSLIVLIDGGDDEAIKQAETLRRAGFRLMRYLHGGYPEWQRQIEAK